MMLLILVTHGLMNFCETIVVSQRERNQERERKEEELEGEDRVNYYVSGYIRR